MSKKKHSILFICHQASRSGAPALLLNIIREFKKHESIPFRILLMREGYLSEDFKTLGKTFSWKRKVPKHSTSLTGKIRNRLLVITNSIRQHYILYCLRDTTFVFSNTIANGAIQKKLLPFKCRFMCYVHEMESGIHMSTSPFALDIALKKTDLFLAVSHAVKDNLIINHQIDERKIRVIPTSLPVVFRKKTDHLDFITSFKKENNIPTTSIIIGVAAPNEWRKGFDLFFPLVTIYFNLFPESDVYFIWKGFKKENPGSFFDLYDSKKFTTCNRAVLLPHGSNSIDTIACFDIHLLISREDPYPLVVLEAASLGIPTVCFSDAGGSPEFVEEDCGRCVPYGDLIKMATCLNQLANDKLLRNQMGANAQEKVAARHDQKNAAPEMMNAIKTLMR